MDYSIKQVTAPFDEATSISLKAGDFVELSGSVHTARDTAHQKMYDALLNNQTIPVNLRNQTVFYTGPSPARPGRAVGSAGPTTAYRMDDYTPLLLRQTGLRGMIGKGNRNKEVIRAIIETKAVYFAAVGGAGALIAESIERAEPVGYESLGTEAIFRFTIKALPLIVAIDTTGNNLYSL